MAENPGQKRTQSPAAMERELNLLLKEETSRYQRAMELAGRLPVRFAAGEDAFAELRELDQLLLDIAVVHGRVRNLKLEWDQSETNPTIEITQTMNRLRKQLESLLTAIQSAEDAAAARQEQLRPQLNEQLKTQKMRSAYRNAITNRRA